MTDVPSWPSEVGPVGSAYIAAACVVFDADGRVMLVRHTYDRLNWEIPGGACLPTEDPAAGAARELEEETGLVVGPGALTGVYFEPEHRLGGPVLHFVFQFAPPANAAPVARPPEIGEVGWFTVDDLPRPISDFTEYRIRDALAGHVAYRLVKGRVWRE